MGDHSSLLSLMRTQHGVIGRGQVLDLGFTDRYVTTRLSRSEWTRVETGVYQHLAVQPTWRSRVMATCLALDAVASHRSAAALWEVDGFGSGVVEVTIARHGGRNRTGVVVHESTQTLSLVVVRRDGIPCTEPARTALDLAGVVSPARLEQAVDDLIRRELVSFGDLERALIDHCRRGRTGCGPLRALLDERAGSAAVPDSVWNRAVARLLTSAGLPAPRFEHPVRVDGHDYRIDLAYPDERLAIELDSVRWHLNRRSFDSDPVRRNRLSLAGWEVLTFTHRFFRDSPELLTASVRAALRARS